MLMALVSNHQVNVMDLAIQLGNGQVDMSQWTILNKAAVENFITEVEKLSL